MKTALRAIGRALKAACFFVLAVIAKVDGIDVATAMLFVGVYLWLHLAAALTVVGALLFVMGTFSRRS